MRCALLERGEIVFIDKIRLPGELENSIANYLDTFAKITITQCDALQHLSGL